MWVAEGHTHTTMVLVVGWWVLFVHRGLVHHDDTPPLTHDDPDCPPNCIAFTLLRPSQILRCWFGKGTPLIAAEPLSWVSPCLTSFCQGKRQQQLGGQSGSPWGKRGGWSCYTNPLCANDTHNPTTKAIVVCALQRPTCPQHRAIDRHQAGMQTQQRKHMGVNPTTDKDTPWRGQIQREKKEGGTSAKSSVLRLTCVPLPHLVLPLSGCACSGTPTKAKRGEARGHP